MKVKDVLEPLVNGTAVELVDFGDILKRGTAFSLWTDLPDRYKEAEIDMITVHNDIVKLYIKKPVVTNFDKLKEIFPSIKWSGSDRSGRFITIKGLDGETTFKASWLRAKYEGSEDE